jgi:putative DNA primase/helicase
MALCPGHEDHNPSLSVKEVGDGRILLHCFAGCSLTKVCADLEIDPRELRSLETRAGSTVARQVSSQTAIASRWIVATYDYVDEQGRLLFQVLRYDPKEFRQRQPDGKGGWLWKVKGVRRVPYRLRELLAADPSSTVFICEGEKDADRLAALGLVATTNPGGTGKWCLEYNEVLRGRNVCILSDNDIPGREHSERVAASLRGLAASVRILVLPLLPDKGDVSDWLDAGGEATQLTTLAKGAPLWKPLATRKRAKRKRRMSRAAYVEPLSPLQPEGQTELANARRFVKLHGENVRYCHPWHKWFVWDGARWRLDDRGEVEQLAKAVPDGIFVAALSINNPGALKFAVKAASARSISAMLTLATSEWGIPVLPCDFNRHSMLLNVANGTLDLRTGRLRPPERKDLLTQLCPVKFHPESECRAWKEFLERILDRRQPLLDYIKRLAGYWLTAQTTEQVLPILYGVGANGKTTFLNGLLSMLGGDYAMQANRDLLVVRHGESHPTELAALFGKRLVVTTETDAGRRLAEGTVKQLTGSDKIRARRMREDFWQFDPTHKLILATNHKPEVRGTDHAIWRRLRLIPFDVVIPDAEQDKTLSARLELERPGILAWAVEGCLEWQGQGLGLPDEVKQATAAYRDEQDILAGFIQDECIASPSYKIQARCLYEAFQQWCDRTGEHDPGRRKFGLSMTERGFERFTNAGTWYRGVGLRKVPDERHETNET